MEPDQVVQLDPYADGDTYAGSPPPEPIELAPSGGETPIITQEDLPRRSFRVKYGLDKILEKSYEEIYADLASGGEDGLRTEAAAELDVRKQLAAENAIKAMAAAKQGKLDPAEAEGLRTLVKGLDRTEDPTTVFEKAYGKAYLSILDEVAARNPESQWNDIVKTIPQEAIAMQEVGSTLVAKKETIRTALENVEAEIKEQGWIPWTIDQAKYAIPGYSNIKLRGNVPTEGVPDVRLGEALEEQRKALYRLDFDSGEFKEKLDKVVNDLKADNPSIARDFLKSMYGMSSDDIFNKDMEIAADLIGLPLIKGAKNIISGGTTVVGKVTGRGALKQAPESAERILAAKEAEKAVKDVVASSTAPDATKATILEGAGDIGEAAVQKSSTQAVRQFNGMNNPTEIAVDNLFSTWKKMEDDLTRNTGEASRELVTRILDASLTVRHNLVDAIANVQKVDRLPEVLASESAVRAIKDDIKRSYPGLSNTILDIPRFVPEPVANVTYAELHIGKPGAEYFSRRTVAENFKKVHGLNDFTIEQKGLGWYLKGYRPLNETGDAVRDLIGNTKNTQTPTDSFFNRWLGELGSYRTTEDTTSLAQRQNAKVATYAPSIAFGILQESAKPIKALKGWVGYTNKRWNDFRDVIMALQKEPDENGLPGRFLDTIGDFQDYFYRAKGIKPDEQQIEAYFAFTRGMEIDRVYRNIAEHRFKTRVGAETHKVFAEGPDGKRMFTPEFDGVLRNEMPGGSDLAVIMGKKVGEERVVNVQTLGKEWDELNESIKAGRRQVVEVYDPERRPLNGFGNIIDERIRYVISDKVETSALKWDHVLRRGGGHVEYDYDFFIKQPKVIDEEIGNSKRKWYEGDVTIMPIKIRAMGDDVAKHLDEVRKLLRAKDVDGARNYSNKNLHIEWDTVRSWFDKRTVDGKVIPPKLNLNERIQVVPKNKTIVNVDNELAKKYGEGSGFDFRDGTTQGSLARQYQVAYTAERDADNLFTLDNVGTKDNPLYQIADVETVDPISTMNRALNRIATSNYLDDYKTFAVEHWLKEAAPHLKVQDLNQLRYAPFKYFNDPEFLKGTPKEIENALRTSHASILQLTGKPSKIDSWIDNTIQNMIDLSYRRTGVRGAEYTAKMLSTTSDPVTFMRGVTFHLKLGAFNISQFLAQSMTYTNIWGIAGPRYAASATYASQLHFWSTLNGKQPILDHLDKMATKLNMPGVSRWRPGEFSESITEGEKTGFFNVGREYAALDNPYSNKVVGTTFGDMLESGTVFFRYGERNSKLAAWHTAYREYRDKNPFTKITDQVRAQILERADLLNVNMSRASNSSLHTGLMSIPAQFYTYQLRATELFFSKRLSNTERARLAAANMLAYGIPVGAGISGLPVTEMEWPYIGGLRTWARNNGYNAGENFWFTVAMEGLPSYLITMATGKTYNVGDRLGAKGLETFLGLIRNDKTIWEMVGGAAGGTFKSIWDTTDGYWAWAKGLMNTGPDFPITGQDYMSLLKEVSSVNNTDLLWTTLNTGRQLSKKGVYLSDADSTDAFVKFFTGMQHQDVSDMQRVNRDLKDQDKKWERAKQWAMREIKFGLQAQEGNNQEQANRYFTRAKGIMEMYDVPQKDWSETYIRAVRDNESLVKKLNFDWFIRKAPDAEKDRREELYRQRLEIEQRNQ